MPTVTFGSDTYGRVKKVGTTAIVTRFFMASGLPLVPKESYYYIGPGESRSEGIPFVYHTRTTEIVGFPLARLDRLSVAMTYVRGFFGALFLVGFTVIVPVIMHFTGERLDEFAMVGTKILVGCLIVGTVGGLLTYLTPFQVTLRERAIREACGELLGVFLDPAAIRTDDALTLADWAAKRGAEISAMTDLTAAAFARANALLQLLDARIQIATNVVPEPLERRTDELLDVLRKR